MAPRLAVSVAPGERITLGWPSANFPDHVSVKEDVTSFAEIAGMVGPSALIPTPSHARNALDKALGRRSRSGNGRKKSMAEQRKVGECFNPWKQFWGVLIPDPVLASDISLGAKVCYGLLARFAGENGDCFPSGATIGGRIGVSARQARTYVAELEHGGYIRRIPRSGRSNRFAFIWHASFDAMRCQRKTSGEDGRTLPDGAEEDFHIRELLEGESATDDLDYQASNRKKRDSSPERCPAEWSGLSQLIAEHLGRTPSRSGLGKIISAAPNKSAKEAIEAISEAVGRGYGGDTEKGPRSISWFVSVTRNYWEDRIRRALPPPAANQAMDREEFNRMTAAFEFTDGQFD